MLPILPLNVYTSSPYERPLHEQPYCRFFTPLQPRVLHCHIHTYHYESLDTRWMGLGHGSMGFSSLCKKHYGMVAKIQILLLAKWSHRKGHWLCSSIFYFSWLLSWGKNSNFTDQALYCAYIFLKNDKISQSLPNFEGQTCILSIGVRVSHNLRTLNAFYSFKSSSNVS
jgi:hypothetical protein